MVLYSSNLLQNAQAPFSCCRCKWLAAMIRILFGPKMELSRDDKVEGRGTKTLPEIVWKELELKGEVAMLMIRVNLPCQPCPQWTRVLDTTGKKGRRRRRSRGRALVNVLDLGSRRSLAFILSLDAFLLAL